MPGARGGLKKGQTGGGRTVAKRELPSKPCAHCGRPMAWRRKWAREWENVLYCSKRCAGEAKVARRGADG